MREREEPDGRANDPNQLDQLNQPGAATPRHYSADAIEHALGLWRDGWQQTRRLNLPEAWRQDYDRAATAAAIAGLHDCQTMQDLLERYYHGDRVMDPVIKGAIQDAADHDRLLNWGLVEDSAFWLRYCRLVGRAVDRGEGAEE